MYRLILPYRQAHQTASAPRTTNLPRLVIVMELSAYLSFILISAAQVATPGPSTLFLVNNALSIGRRRALSILSGDLAAIALLALLSVIGLAKLLHAYPTAFLALRLLGGVYVLWLGWGYLRAPQLPKASRTGALPSDKSDARLWLQSFGVGVSNPKAVLFFAALFPQFIPTQSGTPVLLLLVLTFVAVKFAVLGGYALCARQLGRLLAKPEHARRGRTLTGVVFVGFAVLMVWSALVN